MKRLDKLLPQASAAAVALAALCLFASSCAGVSEGVEVGRPRAESPYPVVLAPSDERRAQSLAEWKALTGAVGTASVALPELDSVTGTLSTLPATNGVNLRLPLVGAEGAEAMSEEEAREALRRFILGSRALLGVEPAELSLVEHAGASGGTRHARYQQNPFDYPLRGGYGLLEITYAPDRRIVSLTNTTVPEAAQLKRVLAGAKTLKVDELTKALVGRAITFTDGSGQTLTRAITSAEDISIREIVVYPVRNEGAAPSLTLHLAWEVAVWRDAPRLVYLDAVNGAQLAAAPASPA